jgi:endo-1,4-beta-xylanase
MRFSWLLLFVPSVVVVSAGCSAGVGVPRSDDEGSGGSGNPSSGGTGPGLGGSTGVGGRLVGGGPGSGGAQPIGGRSSGGSFVGLGGGFASGGATSGGATNGGAPGTGGRFGGGLGGTPASSGGAGSGGAGTGGSGELDCNAAMPTSGAQKHSGNGRGGSGNLAWEIWSNVGTGDMTTYSTPAFSAAWNNSGDYLGRIGFEWGNSTKPYEDYGTIAAQFSYKRTGSGGGYSYVGMYGWSTNPCVEWYIVDDSYNKMPVNPGSTTNKGEVDLDGGTYIMYTRNTTGTGGSRCGSSVTSWVQYYSVRKTARQCGVISLTEHFDAWKAKGMTLGALLEAKILVETGGGQGTMDFPVANVTVTP